ncbi:DUF4102 domain-containing protein [Sinorhizobium meliloti]|nr:DUF4102 domain-containing protein [Sinorhizobium meliloti]
MLKQMRSLGMLRRPCAQMCPNIAKDFSLKLTAAALNSLPEGDYPDHIIPGLTFRRGKRRSSWTLRYRIGDKQSRDTLGYWLGNNPPEGSDHMGLADARERAREVLARIEAGVPIAEEKAPHPKEVGGKTVGDVIDLYEKARKKKGGKGMKTLPEALRTIRRILKDYLALPARQFSKADLRKARDAVAKDAPQMSDRFMSYFGTCWKWAAQEDHVEYNFVPDVIKVGPGLVKRKHVLSPDELQAIWNACPNMESAEGKAYGRLVRFLMVVPARISEGAAIRHGVIIDGRWRQTEEDNKSAREHLLRLPQLAVDQLGTGTAGEFAFPGKKGKLGGISKFKEELDGLSGVSGWRHHDLRRTITTTLQDMTDADDNPLFAREVISALMNHAISGADGHYLHGTMARAKAKALQVWADRLDGILKAKAKHA